MLTFETTSGAYLHMLRKAWLFPDFETSPRGLHTKELINAMFCVTRPTSDPIETMSDSRNAVIEMYTAREKALYETAERSAEVWAEQASRFWRGLANPDGTINSNYGWMINYRLIVPVTFENARHYYRMDSPGERSAWWWAVTSIVMDHDSRQAFVRFNTPDFQWVGNKDQPCTMHMHFMLRDGFLHATTVMRSNDLVKGLAYDLPYFCALLEKMADDLRKEGVVCAVGKYYHFAHSLHVYEKDKDLILAMLGAKYE